MLVLNITNNSKMSKKEKRPKSELTPTNKSFCLNPSPHRSPVVNKGNLLSFIVNC